MLAVPVFVVLQAFVDVFLAPAEHAIDQDGQFVGHRGNRFRCAELAPEATVLSAEVTLAAEQGRGGEAQGGRRAIGHPTGASTDHLATGDPIIGTEPQPGGKVVLVLPARHLEPDFADEGLRHADVDAIDAREIDATDSVQLSPEVELRRVAAGLPAVFDSRPTRSGGRGWGSVTAVADFVGQGVEMLFPRRGRIPRFAAGRHRTS